MSDQNLEKIVEGLDFSHLHKFKKKRKIEVEVEKNNHPKPIPRNNFNSVEYMRQSYNDYLFRPSSFGNLTAAQAKPLTPDQEEVFRKLSPRFAGKGKPLSSDQTELFHKYSLRKMKSNTAILSDGAKTKLQELVRSDRFDRSKTIETKYMDKGLCCEDKSIKLYSEFIGQELHKNTERRSNGFWIGEADNAQGKIRDFKTSWDFNTFPAFQEGIKNMLYEWQLQCYMDIWGFDEAELIYVLVDTPPRLVIDELRRRDWMHDIMTVSGGYRKKAIPFVVETVKNMVYTSDGLFELFEECPDLDPLWFRDSFIELPIEQRIKVFHTQRNENMIKLGKDICILARKYMNSLIGVKPIGYKEEKEEKIVEPKKFTFNV